jgi:DNA-binding protein HU-beta
LFSTISEAVRTDTKVTIPGWLAVERTHRAARTGRNPQTGATIQIAASYGIKLTAGTKLKNSAK